MGHVSSRKRSLGPMIEKKKPCVHSRWHSFGQKFVQLCWLVGCFGFNGPLRQYFSLYRAISQREGERDENG